MGRPTTTDPKLLGVIDETYRPNAEAGNGNTKDLRANETEKLFKRASA